MQMSYSTELLAELYHQWSDGKPYLPEITFEYMGNLAGATVVDFGCGQAPFLKICLEKGAKFCLGFDLNQAMLDKAMEDPEIKKYVSEGKLKLIAKDCLQPISEQYCPFDFAVSQYVLHHCSNEEKLLIFYKNIYQTLKPTGKVIISMSPPVETREEQDAIADWGRLLLPFKSDSKGDDPFLVKIPCIHSKEKVKEGKAGPREAMFYFSSWYWSKEKLMGKLEEAGFKNVHQIDPISFGLGENKGFKLSSSLSEPYIFIVGEK